MPKITSLNELEREGTVIKGAWQFDADHNLSYRVEGENEDAVFTLETSLVAAEPGALVFSLTEKLENGSIVTSLQKLSGIWRANDQNQLEFEVKRESGRNDVLTFKSRWEVGKNFEIVYTREKIELKTKNKQIETLALKGFWDITEKNRLTYFLEGSSTHAFRFRGTFQTLSVIAKKGEIRYQLGAEGTRGTITLFGKWKFSNTLELSFEMEYADGRRHEMRFGAEFAITKDFNVSAALIDKKGEALGVEVTLTREFLEGHAEAFLRLKKTFQESAVYGGIRIPW